MSRSREARILLDTSGVRRVIEALAQDGADVRFVGGCVRDMLLGRAVRDIDIATPDPPDVVTRLLECRGIGVVPTGLRHGTVTAVLHGRGFEVTTLRVDVRTDGRRADVAFTGDWHADAARRDFTVNAMSMTPQGEVFDYFGGLGDLERRRIRFVGDAAARVREDALRVLRFFRFLAHYGEGEPDGEALAACAAARESLDRLAAERIQAELVKLLGAPDPLPSLRLMDTAGVLGAVLPEAGDLGTLAVLTGFDDRDPHRRLAALVPSQGAAAARRLRFSKAVRRRLSRLAPPEVVPEADWPPSRQRQALYDLGAGIFRDLVLLAWAADRPGRAGRWRAMLETAARWNDPRFPLRGADVVGAGVRPGPRVSAILKDVETWWRGEDFRPGREDCLKRVRAAAAEVA